MNYLIQAYNEKGIGLLGTANQRLVIGAKTMVRVNNCLRTFKPDPCHTEIRISTYTYLYDENTHKLIRTISAIKLVEYDWEIYIPEEGAWDIIGKHRTMELARESYLKWANRKRIPAGSYIYSHELLDAPL